MTTKTQHQVFFITGVSGSGKTTIGRALSSVSGLPYFDADTFHSRENIAKMSNGQPLTDADRKEWLESIHQFVLEYLTTGSLILGCSALKEQYRRVLSRGCTAQCHWVFLKGHFDILKERLENRKDHFMPASLLASQLEAMEEPAYGLVVDVQQPVEKSVEQIRQAFGWGSQFGIIGMGVMGSSLSRNMASRHFRLSLYNRFVKGSEEGLAQGLVDTYQLRNALAFEDLTAFTASLQRPRNILMMLPAGNVIDDMIAALLPLLDPDDILIDGGNAHYSDTENRYEALKKKDILYLGVGISGGEEGALKGPSIMPGGSMEAYIRVAPCLEAIAALDKHGKPCCAYIGKGGAGHFVKMVHNGIEYAEMQLLAEVYSLLRYAAHWPPEKIATELESWQQGPTDSYLLRITTDIMRRHEHGALVLDQISDIAGNKGTGGWTTISACELGVPIPTITAALYERYISAEKDVRVETSKLYNTSLWEGIFDVGGLQKAYQMARILNHQQGFRLISVASARYGWQINISELARIWTNGCILRSALMEQLTEILDTSENLLFHPEMIHQLKAYQPALSELLSMISMTGIPVPCLTSTDTYFKAMIQADSAANLIQAQRDYFGAHTYRLKSDPTGESHHTDWLKKD